MRKTLLFSIGLIMAGMLQAQIQKGDVQLIGSVSYLNVDNNGNGRSSFSITPQAGLFLSDKTAIGLSLGINSSATDVINNGNGETVELNSNLFVFGAFARFHKSVADNFYLFLEPSIAFGTGKEDQFNAGEADRNTFTAGVRPGLLYFLTPKFAMDMRLGGLLYNRQKTEFGGVETETDIFNFNLDFSSVGFGISYFIR